LAEQSSESKPRAKAGKARRRDLWRAIKDHLTTQPPESRSRRYLTIRCGSKSPCGSKTSTRPGWQPLKASAIAVC
jgi:hypothetical protein